MKRLACLSLLLLFTTGCQGLLHELQPHRLRRLNYFSRPGRADAGMYSVSDNLQEPVDATQAGLIASPKRGLSEATAEQTH